LSLPRFIPTLRSELLEHDDYIFELKMDVFLALPLVDLVVPGDCSASCRERSAFPTSGSPSFDIAVTSTWDFFN